MRDRPALWCALFAAVFTVCYATTSWFTAQYASLPAWNFAFERFVPFVPGASVVYLTITPVLLLAPWLLQREEVAPFAAVLCVETLIASACFLLFPQTVAWVRPAVHGWARMPFSVADALNLEYNQFPSLHVAFAVSVAWMYRPRRWWMLWSTAVALSTWVMWEHHLVDLGGGFVLGGGSMLFLHPVMKRRFGLAVPVNVEWECVRQCALFSRRHVRYFVIFVAIYAPSLLHWRRYRAVRTGFCAAQWIDDLLDGDRPSSREPLEIVDELVAQMRATRFEAQALSQLVAALFQDLTTNQQRDFVRLVECMRRDRERVLAAELWTASQLDAHHERTFALSVDLLLATTGCRARAAQVPSLVRALGWCSVFRDLEDDLRKGLVNIPSDLPEAAWRTQTHARALLDLDAAAREIAALGDPRARRILSIFRRSIQKFAARPPFVLRGVPLQGDLSCSE